MWMHSLGSRRCRLGSYFLALSYTYLPTLQYRIRREEREDKNALKRTNNISLLNKYPWVIRRIITIPHHKPTPNTAFFPSPSAARTGIVVHTSPAKQSSSNPSPTYPSIYKIATPATERFALAGFGEREVGGIGGLCFFRVCVNKW